jgi:nucleotide-binding universal stress UspA family protein
MKRLAKTILVATDFSPCSERALDYAIALAQAAKAKIFILFACQLPAFGFPEGAMTMTRDVVDDMQRDARRTLDELIARHQGALVPLVPKVEFGDPRDAILATAHDVAADLIVMGTHGRRGFQRALMGSVAESVVRTARCPVLTVRDLVT